MKKKTLTTAVLAGIGGVAGLAGMANAVNLNSDGLGQVLIYPYYTVNAGNQTLLSIVNTTDRVKAVKVRFLEGLNSREVLDFNLYLSPFDVWTAALFSLTPDGPANLVTRDTSCTVPDIIGQTASPIALPVTAGGDRYVPFRTGLLASGPGDPGPASADRTREGHFEMIEMAVLNNVTQGSASAATHNPPGQFPADCDQLNDAWSNAGYWTANRLTDTEPPAGGIFGAASVVDAEEGTQVSFDADAIAAFTTTVQHRNPGDTLPTLAQADFDMNGVPGIDSVVFDPAADPIDSVISSDWLFGEDAVSAVFMRNQIYNEYALDSDLDASTEWVLTFPTKRFYTDPLLTAVALPPFTEIFDFGDGGACEDVGVTYWDREEATVTIQTGFSPGDDPDRARLCWETNVVRFVNPGLGLGGSGLFGIHTVGATQITLETSVIFENGWARFDLTRDNLGVLTGHTYTDLTGDIYNGLPVTGFAAQVIKNGALAGGTLANYAGLFRHKADKDIIGS